MKERSRHEASFPVVRIREVEAKVVSNVGRIPVIAMENAGRIHTVYADVIRPCQYQASPTCCQAPHS